MFKDRYPVHIREAMRALRIVTWVSSLIMYVCAVAVTAVVFFGTYRIRNYVRASWDWWKGYHNNIAFVIAITFLVVCVCLIAQGESWRHGRIKKNENDSVFADEFPIVKASQDLLGRKQFVSMLVNLLSSIGVKQGAAFVGLYAPWGEGKTSVVNLLKERVKEERLIFKFIDFSPWKYCDQDLVSASFFDILSMEIKDASREFKMLSRIMKAQYVGAKARGTFWWVEFLQYALESVFCTESDIRDVLEYVLPNEHIVLVVDDLERLPNEDAFKTIRFLKAQADLPGLIVLFVADKKRLEAAVGDKVAIEGEDKRLVGEQYLEKIIPIHRELPPASAEMLKRLLKGEIDKIINDIFPETKPEVDCDMNIIMPYITSYRRLKMFVNALRVDLSFVKAVVHNGEHIGLNVNDFIIISLTRHFESGFYEKLQKMHSRLGVHSSWGINKGYSEEWMEKNLWKYISCDDKGPMKSVARLAGVQSSIDTTTHAKSYYVSLTDTPESYKDLRLSSAAIFPYYFNFEVSDLSVFAHDKYEFEEAIRRNIFPIDLITRLNENDGLRGLLFAYNDPPTLKSEEEEISYMRLLVNISKMTLQQQSVYDPDRPWGGSSLYSAVYNCLRIFCKKVQRRYAEDAMRNHNPKPNRVGENIVKITKELNGLYIISKYLEYDSSSHEPNTKSLTREENFTHEQYQELEEYYLGALLKESSEGNIWKHEEFFDLVRAWRIIVKKYHKDDLCKAFGKANDAVINDYESLSRMLVFFSLDKRAEIDSDDSLFVEYDEMKKYFTVDQINKIKATLEKTNNLHDRDKLFLCALDYCLKQEALGNANVSAEDQLKHIREKNPLAV